MTSSCLGGKLWRRVSTPFFVEEPHGRQVLDHSGSVHVLGQAVSWVLRAKHLLDHQVAIFDPLLDPEK